MPAPVTHYQFALRVMSYLKKYGVRVPDQSMALIGAQGPDIFFFHRIFPWERGASHAVVGSKLHRSSPALIFEGFRDILNNTDSDYDAVLSYIQGMFCHYALDRVAHPYIYWAQNKLAQNDPTYGINGHQYHFRIESALDTIILRRETGRLISSLNLIDILPGDGNSRYAVVGMIYHKLLLKLFGLDVSSELLALAPKDMRHALFFMNDRAMLRQKLIFRPIEKLIRRGHFITSLLRPHDTNDWDYANISNATWVNPYDEKHTSTDSFFDLYNLAVKEALDMISDFVCALPDGKSMHEVTQDRGFASDLPGIYTGQPSTLSLSDC